ncbi:hypothetical protein QPK87_05665 [Kamptonema cortianum]|nr:hypothetical protein [Geitlerinema splendidum]MDK3156062.1 hypothetical protein [Kamptonema cortianum]
MLVTVWGGVGAYLLIASWFLSSQLQSSRVDFNPTNETQAAFCQFLKTNELASNFRTADVDEVTLWLGNKPISGENSILDTFEKVNARSAGSKSAFLITSFVLILALTSDLAFALRFFPILSIAGSLGLTIPCVNCTTVIDAVPLGAILVAAASLCLITLIGQHVGRLFDGTLLLLMLSAVSQPLLMLADPKFCIPCVVLGISFCGTVIAGLDARQTNRDVIAFATTTKVGVLAASILAFILASPVTGSARSNTLSVNPSLLVGQFRHGIEPGITIITSPNCMACHVMRRFLEENGINYRLILLQDVPAALRPEVKLTPFLIGADHDGRIKLVTLGMPQTKSGKNKLLTGCKELIANSSRSTVELKRTNK